VNDRVWASEKALQAALSTLWAAAPERPGKTILMSVKTAAALDYWVKRFRRRATFKAKRRQRRAIGRGHW
jgi:hypothetical protein